MANKTMSCPTCERPLPHPRRLAFALDSKIRRDGVGGSWDLIYFPAIRERDRRAFISPISNVKRPNAAMPTGRNLPELTR